MTALYMGRPPATLVARELSRGAVIIAQPGYGLALAETLVCESTPGHRDADWTALGNRRTRGHDRRHL